MPYKSSVPLFWRLKKSKYNLIGTKCNTCDKVFFPKKSLCPNCRRRGNLDDFQFSGKGKIVSFTVIRVPPEGFEKYAPYAAAIIELDEGARLSGQIVGDFSKVETGKPVRAVFRKINEDGNEGLINYGLKWELSE
ncbi:MAG: Zn-ribbon domain-containing OB-fold protein [Candidatus Aenigmatarchaeota archaeon]|nr:MAG: Zn-ribbon domain-containing OB-fold protein [Candidatus Aenigmarchaeota archaeon]